METDNQDVKVKYNGPDLEYIGEMCNRTFQKCDDPMERIIIAIDIFKYMLKFSNFILDTPQIAHQLRTKAQATKISVNDYVGSDFINFDNGLIFTDICQQMIDMTDFVSSFDCADDADENLPLLMKEPKDSDIDENEIDADEVGPHPILDLAEEDYDL